MFSFGYGPPILKNIQGQPAIAKYSGRPDQHCLSATTDGQDISRCNEFT